jgi:hypothetical protein
MNDADKKQLIDSINLAACNCCKPLSVPETLEGGITIKFVVMGAEFIFLWGLIQPYILVSIRSFRKTNYKISNRIPEEDMVSDIKEYCYKYFTIYGPSSNFAINFTYLIKNYFYDLKTFNFNPPSKRTIFYCDDIDNISGSSELISKLHLFEDCTKEIDFWSSIPMHLLHIVKQIVLDGVKLSSIARQENVSGKVLWKQLYKDLSDVGIINEDLSLKSNGVWKLRFLAESLDNKSKVKRGEFVKRFNINSNKNIDVVVIPERNITKILQKLGITRQYFYDHAYRTSSSNLKTLPKGFGAWYKVDDGDWVNIVNINNKKEN